MADIEDPLDSLPTGNEEDGDVCRVCRVEGDEEEPLIYPCKCSGSVRYVHPNCLKNWLAHSQKRYCEICGHRYTFTKIYPTYLPAKIPKVVFIRQTVLCLYRVICHVHRFWLAVLGWLIVLPSLNLITLRTLVWLADTSISYPSGLANPNNGISQGENSTSSILSNDSTDTDNVTISGSRPEDGIRIRDIVLRPMTSLVKLGLSSWRSWYRFGDDSLPGLVFRGQILSITLAAVLIGLVFFREWIAQQNLEDIVPGPAPPEEAINPDEWIYRRGVARRVRALKDVELSDYEVSAVLRRAKRAKKRGEAGVQVDPLRPIIEDGWAAEDIEDVDITEEERDAALERYKAGKEKVLARRLERIQLASLDMPQYLYGRDFDENGPINPPRIAGPSTRRIQPRPSSWPMDLTPADAMASPPNTPAYSEPSPFKKDSEHLPPIDGVPRPCGPAGAGDVAYTAPELLGEKGKEMDSDEDRSSLGLYKGAEADPSKPSESAELTRQVDWRGQRIVLEDGQIISFDTATSDSNEHDAASQGESSGAVVEVDAEQGSSASTSSGNDLDDENPPWPPTEPAVLQIDTAADQLLLHGDANDHNGDPNEDGNRQLPDLRPDIDADRAALIQEMGQRLVEGGDDLDEDGPWEREDWMGILEVVGLVGPVINLVQNLAFAITIMGAALTLLVGLPIVAGKVILALDILRSGFAAAKLFFRVARGITNPIIDVVQEIAQEVVLFPAWSSFKALERIVAAKLHLDAKLPQSSLAFSDSNTTLLNRNTSLAVLEFGSQIGNRLQQAYLFQRGISLQLATSDNLRDIVWCMFVGYGLVALAIGCIVVAGEWNIGGISASLLTSIRHHALFLKLALFMGIELILFPLLIGAVIHVSVMPLFESLSASILLQHLGDSPFGAIFVAWLIGTVFMFTFATGLAHIRKSTRQGGLFFIRDPGDESFSPVKDILERSAGSQAKKLGISAIMYTIVVVSIFGVASWGLAYQPLFPFLPLRTQNMSPLSSVPFDLLILHVVVPPTLAVLRPRVRTSRLWDKFWHSTCSNLRLSCLLHGRTYAGECQAGPYRMGRFWAILDNILQLVFGNYDPTATYARVPASDQVALLPPTERRKSGVFVQVDADGSPTSAEAKMRMLRQDQRARAMKRDPTRDYTIVWLPQYWRTRIHVFVSISVTVTGVFIALVFFTPIVIGRAMFAMFVNQTVHDGYAYLAGGYLCLVAAMFGSFVRRKIKRYGVAGRFRSSGLSTRAKRVLLPIVANVYALVILYLIIPTLVGIIFELSVAQVWRYGVDTRIIPVIHLWDTWALGNAIDCILVGARSVFPTRYKHGDYSLLYNVSHMLHSPLGRRPHALNKIFLPAFRALMIPILVPTALLGFIIPSAHLFNLSESRQILIFRFIYSATTPFLLTFALRGILVEHLGALRQNMIDAEYEIEEKVENYQPDERKTSKDGATIEVLDGEADGDQRVEDDWWDEDDALQDIEVVDAE